MASGVVSTYGTRGHISRLPSATPKSTDDPFSSQPCTNSLQGRGWFGWHTTPPAAGSRGNAIVVASEATLQDESERKMIQVHPRDDIVEENAVGEEEPARGNRALLLKHIRERMNAKLLRSYQTAAVGTYAKGSLHCVYAAPKRLRPTRPSRCSVAKGMGGQWSDALSKQHMRPPPPLLPKKPAQ